MASLVTHENQYVSAKFFRDLSCWDASAIGNCIHPYKSCDAQVECEIAD